MAGSLNQFHAAVSPSRTFCYSELSSDCIKAMQQIDCVLVSVQNSLRVSPSLGCAVGSRMCALRLYDCVFVRFVCKYFESPGGVGRVRLFGEEARRLGPLVEQLLGREALSLRDVPDLETGNRGEEVEGGGWRRK